MITAAEFQCSGDTFLVWQRGTRRPELFRGRCQHVPEDCPFASLDIITGGAVLPRIPRRILCTRVLIAVARTRLQEYADAYTPAHLDQASPLFKKLEHYQIYDRESHTWCTRSCPQPLRDRPAPDGVRPPSRTARSTVRPARPLARSRRADCRSEFSRNSA